MKKRKIYVDFDYLNYLFENNKKIIKAELNKKNIDHKKILDLINLNIWIENKKMENK